MTPAAARPIRAEVSPAIVMTFDAKDDDRAPLMSELLREAAEWLETNDVDVLDITCGVNDSGNVWLDIYCNTIHELDDDR